MALPGDRTAHSAHPGATRLMAGVVLLMIVSAPSLAAWEGYERLTRESLLARLAEPASRQSRELKGVNLSDLDLTGIDFHGADLAATVFNGAHLQRADLDKTNLTVAFFESADLSQASLRGATLFSTQLAGAKLRGADLSGARLIGDLHKVDLTDAKLTHVNGAADMKNQSMGLMRTSMVNAIARHADLSDSDFSRAELTFSDFTGATLVNTALVRADFSGSNLSGADLTGADLRDAVLIDTDLTNANLTRVDLTGADLQGVRGLESATKSGARGLPPAATISSR